MARKVVSRKAKAAEAEAAEKLISDAKAKKKAGKRKSKKSAADMRLRLYWGVFSQNLKRVAVFEFDQKKDAEKRAVGTEQRREIAPLCSKSQRRNQARVDAA